MTIDVSMARMLQHYPLRPLQGDFKKGFGNTAGTPCCFQLSHPLNMCGLTVPFRSNRRENMHATIDGKRWNQLLVVDEMRWFLNQQTPEEQLRGGDTGNTSPKAMKEVIAGRNGILCFWKKPYGTHVELWKGDRTHQVTHGDLWTKNPEIYFFEISLY